MNVLSLFDGMSCGQIALDQLGIKVDNYYAAEIDKYAIEIAKKNYPNTIHLGNVTKIKGSDLPQIDLLMGGSPCQGFSFAGKQLNFDDPRSALFFEFVRLLKETNPKYFLLENVRMKKEYQDVITEHLSVEPIMINSALVSAQNRVRLYWTNIPNITQPKDKGIVLKDILQDEIGYELSDAKVDRVLNSPRGKGYFYDQDKHHKIGTVIAGYHKEPTDGSYIKCAAFRGRYYDHEGKRTDHKESVAGKTTQHLEIRDDEKTNTLTTVQKDNVIVSDYASKKYAPHGAEFADPYNKTPLKGDKSTTLRTNSSNGNMWIKQDELRYRKLTPLECERLQTVPDGYTKGASNTQRYKMLGNGWTVEVIKHIFKNMEE